MRRPGGLFLIAGVLLGTATASAPAEVFEPTRFDDPPPGTCKPDDCSLREAIDAANEQPNRDTIQLAKGTYEIEIAHVPGSDNNETGDLSFSYPTTIKGKGSKKTKVDANGLDRVFFVGGLTSEVPVKFQALTMKGGDPGAVPTDPQHASTTGGGIYAYTEAVTFKQVAIRSNEAALGGGARLQATNLKMIDSTISRNAANEGGGILFVAAIFETPVAKIRTSTISNNGAAKGGGILADGYHPNPSLFPPDVTITNSTIAGNRASADGGGIMADNDAILTLDNSTVAHNRADEDGAGGGVGGGVYQHSGAVFGMGDSVVAENTLGLAPGTAQQCEGAFGTSDGLVRQTQSSGTCSFGGIYTIVSDALIGLLAGNGGPTQTVKLLSGSPAIGFTDGCPNLDQRGEPRPDEDCDAGAFERKGL